MTTEKSKFGATLSPLRYSILLTVFLPFGVILIIFCACLLALTWPFIPFFAYYQRAEERALQAKTEKEKDQLELFNE